MQIRLIACVVAAAVLAGGANASAQEKKIQRSALPPAVEKTVAEQSEGATVRGYAMEKEKGRTYYEAELTRNGHSRDVLVDSAGGVVEIEEQVALDSLPADVRSGLKAKAAGGRIGKVESLTKHDKLVAYEAVVTRHGKKHEIQVGPDGKALTHEE
jgi:hypothetical protein